MPTGTVTMSHEMIRNFVIENFLFGQGGEELSNDDEFLKMGIMDSMGVLELVGFIEEEFGISMEDEELVPENLDSVNRIMAFVTRKRAGS